MDCEGNFELFFRENHEALHNCVKPYQYVGGEYLSYNKNFDDAKVKFAFVFRTSTKSGLVILGFEFYMIL